MCKGAGGQSTSNQSSSVSIPSNVLQNYNQVYGMGQAAAAQPFQQYSGEFVAPVNSTEQSGINTISGAGNWIDPTWSDSTSTLGAGLASANPLYGGAAGLAGASTEQVNASPVNAAAIGQYMSPYQSSVVDATTAWLNQQNAQQQTNLTSNAISQGAFGGDRSGIAAGVLSGQQNLANASTIAGLNNQNYAQALAAAQQQQGVNLAAGQANRTALQTGSQLMGAAGNNYLNAGVAGGNAYNTYGTTALGSTLQQGQAQLGAGLVPQQTQQAQDTALYNQFLQQQAYPFQTTQFLGNLAMGMGPLEGSTTTQTGSQFAPQPFFSDDSLKEDVHEIGRMKNGLKIVRYRYKEDPHKLLRIGFLASDVEKKMPEAVTHHDNGLRSVDYERAARARGGVANENWHDSMGGAVEPGDGMRVAFAQGGGGAPAMPGFDPSTMAAIVAAQSAMYPGGAGRPGVSGSGPRGVALTEINRSTGAPKYKLSAPPIAEMRQPKQEQPGLAQDIKEANELGSLGKGASSAYTTGSDALFGSAARGTAGSPGYTPATGGLIGSGGTYDWNSGWAGRNTAGLAGNTNTPTIAAPPPLDPTDVGGWGTYARGGRLKRAMGGSGMGAGGAGGEIPYDATDGYVPTADFQPFARTPMGEQQRMSSGLSGSGSGSGGSGILGSLNSLVGLGKNAASGVSGLSSLFSGPMEGADMLPMSGLGGITGDAASGAAGLFGAADAGAGAAGGIGAVADLAPVLLAPMGARGVKRHYRRGKSLPPAPPAGLARDGQAPDSMVTRAPGVKQTANPALVDRGGKSR